MSSPSLLGSTLQHFNAISHREPLATILHLLVFVSFLAFGTPIGIGGLLIYGAFRIYISRLKPHAPGPHLAVVVTGCDSGFGRELALAAAGAGFTVFAGCLTPETSWPGGAALVPPRLVLLPMDVTSDAQVQAVVDVVQKWRSEDDTRVLHALVNNAGVGVPGLIDWLDMTSYEVCMNGT
jgi:short chain dehydrogenase